MNIGNLLTHYLAESGVSQAELARRSGLPESSISRLKDQESCNLKTWEALRPFLAPTAIPISIPGGAHEGREE
jgi:transcriptional regulator with XRE-family HTH domain